VVEQQAHQQRHEPVQPLDDGVELHRRQQVSVTQLASRGRGEAEPVVNTMEPSTIKPNIKTAVETASRDRARYRAITCTPAPGRLARTSIGAREDEERENHCEIGREH
jgi:hypothetical protein